MFLVLVIVCDRQRCHGRGTVPTALIITLGFRRSAHLKALLQRSLVTSCDVYNLWLLCSVSKPWCLPLSIRIVYVLGVGTG
jgi:hypothetical protein